jgi:hypothetical protein
VCVIVFRCTATHEKYMYIHTWCEKVRCMHFLSLWHTFIPSALGLRHCISGLCLCMRAKERLLLIFFKHKTRVGFTACRLENRIAQRHITRLLVGPDMHGENKLKCLELCDLDVL